MISSKIISSRDMTWKQKKEQLINNLPTLLDVLENISLQEEYLQINPGHFRGLFPTHYEEGKFTSVKDVDGQSYLLPVGLLPFTYYRGESQYHPNCKPSLFRPNMTSSKIFLERLRSCELELIIESHPITRVFRNGTMVRFPEGNFREIHFSVDSQALSQHYGICTDLLDLTVNKWVAAFFACTKCHDDVYEPIEENKGYGVFYIYGIEAQADDMMSNLPISQRKVRPVGLQPFSRPGEQGGYVIRLSQKENFNHHPVRKIKFRHDAKVAQLIFNYANRSKKLFPYDPLQDKAKVIRNTTTFSKAAYKLVVERHYSDKPEDVIKSWMRNENIKLQEQPIARFTDQEKLKAIEEWQVRSKSIYKKIIVPFVVWDPTDTKRDSDLVE